MNTLRVDTFSDFVCPWCFIGTRRLKAAVASFGEELEVVERHHPYMLHGDAPPEGIDLTAMLEAKYGTKAGPVFERVEAAARESGVLLDMSKQSRTYSTIAAHTLMRHAAEKGTEGSLAEALFTAYFLESKNIADESVLTQIATMHGFTEAEAAAALQNPLELELTRAEVREANRLGIRGVPLFILNGRTALSGAQPVDVFRQAIRKELATEPPGS